MDREEVIGCVEDLLSVESSCGIACVDKATQELLEGILDCLQNSAPVIRCRDCCYAEASEHPGCIVCTAWGCRSDLDGYCHQAERK